MHPPHAPNAIWHCVTEREIPVDTEFTLEKNLSDPVTVRNWQLKGLPADESSTENGLFATMGR